MNQTVSMPLYAVSDTVKVRAEGKRVLVVKNGLLVADLDWKAAQEFGKALMSKGKEAEAVHWAACEKRLGKPMPCKDIFGIPLLRDEMELERLG